MRRPFLTDPSQLASVEGQQYLLLRPAGPVSASYRAMQAELLGVAPDGVTHPHTEHITLRAFSEPRRREEVTDLVRGWAARQHPIDIVADAVDAFPAPWQIVILRLARTPSLVAAYATLTSALDCSGLRRLDELALDDWVFHLSLVYGKTLDAATWAELDSAARRELADRPHCTATEAEFVWYEDGQENVEVIPLG
ncbi:hypothetical protein HD600_001803 [Microbacterium ginsengiterrae]|uniref:2'-5' RNA ligase superfamily protein n=1 Tax=Microbacterium ginsengiterrae TaxID=546115 RepID=A0A7W9FBH1_9MICO|nr:hypothetical protein [Microbacterium ginsengiterrae]